MRASYCEWLHISRCLCLTYSAYLTYSSHLLPRQADGTRQLRASLVSRGVYVAVLVVVVLLLVLLLPLIMLVAAGGGGSALYYSRLMTTVTLLSRWRSGSWASVAWSNGACATRRRRPTPRRHPGPHPTNPGPALTLTLTLTRPDPNPKPNPVLTLSQAYAQTPPRVLQYVALF